MNTQSPSDATVPFEPKYPVDLTLVIPLLNEEESLRPLMEKIRDTLNNSGLTYEIIFIDDGSKDGSMHVLEELHAAHKEVNVIQFRRNFGKAAAYTAGFARAKGQFVITMDADLQDDPAEIPGLLAKLDEGYDLVSGWKKKRFDPLGKTLPSKFFNWVTGRVSGIKIHDFNCGLKAYRNEVVKNIEVYGEMHRYIPVIAKWNGFPKIGEKAVEHRARKFGSTKFGMDRFINGFLDLMSLYFMSKFGKRPMHFFGLYGVLSFVIGFAMAAWILVDKLVHIWQNTSARLVTDNPLFYIGLIAMVIGTQLFLAGFLGELVSRSNPERDQYNIRQRTDS